MRLCAKLQPKALYALWNCVSGCACGRLLCWKGGGGVCKVKVEGESGGGGEGHFKYFLRAM